MEKTFSGNDHSHAAKFGSLKRTTCGCINCPVPRIECRPGEGIRRRDWFAGAHVLGLGTARDDHLVTLSDNSPWSGLLPIASHIEDGELCDILKALCRWGGGGGGGFFISQSLFLPSVSKSLSHTLRNLQKLFHLIYIGYMAHIMGGFI